MNNVKAIIIALMLSIISFVCLAQDRTVPEEVSRREFNRMVYQSIALLQGTELKEISDKEHVSIMYCLNTIGMTRMMRTTNGLDEVKLYENLEKLSEQKDYVQQLMKIYPDWIPNRGMGCYFRKLKMELGGTPSADSYYKIKN
jgi:hypothetical protein